MPIKGGKKKVESKLELVSTVDGATGEDGFSSSNQEEKNQAALAEVDLDRPCNVIVKGLPKKVREEGLYEMFLGCGAIHSTKVMMDLRRHGAPQSKQYGFVLFKEGRSALKAVEQMHGAKIPIPVIYLPAPVSRKKGGRFTGPEEAAVVVPPAPLFKETELIVAIAGMQEDAGGVKKKVAAPSLSSPTEEEDGKTKLTNDQQSNCNEGGGGNDADELGTEEVNKTGNKQGQKGGKKKSSASSDQPLPSERLYITNIPHYASKEQLVNHLKKYGKVKEVSLLPTDPKNKNCRNHRGVAFARFATVAEAKAAVQGLDNETMVCGYKTQLDHAGEVTEVVVVPRAIRVKFIEDADARDRRISRHDAKQYERRMSPSSIEKRTLIVTSTEAIPSATPGDSPTTPQQVSVSGVVSHNKNPVGVSPLMNATTGVEKKGGGVRRGGGGGKWSSNKMPVAMMPPGTSPPQPPTDFQSRANKTNSTPQRPPYQPSANSNRQKNRQQQQNMSTVGSSFQMPPNYGMVLPPPAYAMGQKSNLY